MSRILYSYFRSSAAFRARIALALKRLPYEYAAINLMPGIEEQRSERYKALNPQGRVPFLVDGDMALSQSPAILEYLEEAYPSPALMPDGIEGRARVRQMVSLIACDIHPLNNSSVLGYLKREIGADEAAVKAWYGHWITAGFEALEVLLADRPGPYAFGHTVTLADVCLVPQVWNARRFGVALDAFPNILAVDAACMKLPAFQAALPENQPDAPAA